jgi:hypothetical protein
MQKNLLALSAILTAACAGGSAAPPAPAPAPAPSAPAAQAPAQPAARPATPPAAPAKDEAKSDPTGSFGISLSYGGQALGATLTVTQKDDGTYAGSLYVEQAGTIPFNTVSVSGNKVQASLSSPDGSNVGIEYTVEGDALSGSWRSSAGDGSQISGRRIKE